MCNILCLKASRVGFRCPLKALGFPYTRCNLLAHGPPPPQFLLFPPKPTIGPWVIGARIGGLIRPQKQMFSLMISMVFHSAHISTSLGDRGSHWGSDQSSFGGSRMHSQALRFSPKSTSEKTFRTVGALGAPLGSPGASPGRKIFSEVDIGEKV